MVDEVNTGETIGESSDSIQTDTVVANTNSAIDSEIKKGNYYQKKLAEVSAEREALAKELDNERQNKLKEQNNYKELWELEKNKRTQAEEKATRVTQSYFNGLKMSAIEQEAIKAGIHESALEDLSLLPNDIVQIETTSTGNAHVLGAKEFVDYLKEKKAHWFKNGMAPKFNGSNPTEIKSRDLSADDILKLQKSDPAAYKSAMQKLLNQKK